MYTTLRRAAGLSLMSMALASPVAAQDTTTAAVRLNATGSFARGGEFTGSVTLNRFEQRGNEIVAIGFVEGTLRRGNRTIGTAVAGEVAWPVAVSAGGIAAVSGRAPAGGQVRPVSWSTEAPRPAPIVPAQAEDCPVLQIALGPVNVDLFGVDVTIDPIAFALTGESGTPLGDLVCAVSDLLGNVAGLVELLNSILGLLTGLLGGLLGGIGGIVP